MATGPVKWFNPLRRTTDSFSPKAAAKTCSSMPPPSNVPALISLNEGQTAI